MEKRLINMK